MNRASFASHNKKSEGDYFVGNVGSTTHQYHQGRSFALLTSAALKLHIFLSHGAKWDRSRYILDLQFTEGVDRLEYRR